MALKRSPKTFPGDAKERMMKMAMRKSDDDDGGEEGDIEEDNSQRMALKRSPKTFPGEDDERKVSDCDEGDLVIRKVMMMVKRER